MVKQVSTNFNGKNILVIGSGISGMGAKAALLKNNASVYILDESKNKSLLTKKFVAEFNIVVISPSVDANHKIFAIANNLDIEVISEPELGARLYDGTIVGITGTNGKTTVVQLLGTILNTANKNASVCGNVGYSFAQSVVEQSADIAVVELSSFQLEQMGAKLKPHIAAILNISPDHLDRHGTMDAYAGAKKNIAKNQDSSDYLLLSYDDIPISYLNNFCPNSIVLYVSTKQKVKGAYLLGDILYFLDEPIVKVDDIKIRGLHNVSNALFCIASAKLLNVSNDDIRKALATFDLAAHRIHLCGHVADKKFFNDSKGTNIGASLAACNTMIGDTALILGGKDKGYDFDELFMALPHHIRHIYAIGETAPSIIASANKIGFASIEKTNIEQAVKSSLALSVKNVLLSPACSSFDRFKDYKDRGAHFEQLVKELGKAL